jgi:threonine dehydrogenase-like Zn-dependent dehydrogenase
MGGVPGVLPARVVVIGGGVVGTHAAKIAVGMGADVTVFDRSLPRLRYLDDVFNGFKTVFQRRDRRRRSPGRHGHRRGADPRRGGAESWSAARSCPP